MSERETYVETLVTPAEIPVANPAGVYSMTISQDLSSFGGIAGTVLDFLPRHRFKVIAFFARISLTAAGTDAEQVLTLAIGDNVVTGGTLTLTEANASTGYGTNIDSTAITAANEGALTDNLVVALEAGGTVFDSGVVDLVLTLQNLDG